MTFLTDRSTRLLNFGLAIIVSLGFTFTILSSAPAFAGTCTAGVVCGTVRHGNDTGYDPDIIIRCDYNRPATNKRVPEGHSSREYCKDTDQVYVRSGEEFWCIYYRSTTYGPPVAYWKRTFDATGWHQIHNDFNRNCTLRQD